MNSLDRLTGFYWWRAPAATRARSVPSRTPSPSRVHQQVRRLEAELGCASSAGGEGPDGAHPARSALHDVVAPFLELLRLTVDALRTETFGGVLRSAPPRSSSRSCCPAAPRAPPAPCGGRRHAHGAPAPDVTLLRTASWTCSWITSPRFPPTSRRGRSRGSGAASSGEPSAARRRRGSIRAAHRAAAPHLRCRPGEPRCNGRRWRPWARRSGAVRRQLRRTSAPRLRRRGARLLRRARAPSPRSAPRRHPRHPPALAGLRATGACRVASRRSEPDACRGARRRAVSRA